MSRALKMVRAAALAIGLAAILISVAALMVLRSPRFQNWAREKIVAAIAEGTGGRTEAGSLKFDIRRLQISIGNLVIHGSETPGAPPFIRVAQIDLTARLLAGGRLIGISYLGVQRPEVNIIVFPDGRTNLPTPKPSEPSKNTPLETVVDLAVGHFELNGGRLTLNDRPQPLDLTADNLRAQLWYRVLQRDYTGRLSLQPVYVVSGRNTPVTCAVTLPVVLEQNRIRVEGASIATAHSTLHLDGSIDNLRQPSFSGRVQGQLELADLDRVLGLRLPTSGRGLPRDLQLDVSASASADRIRVASLALDLGQSHFRAGGLLKGAGGSMQFDGSLSLPELTRLAALSVRPEGSLVVHGDAALDAANRYRISGHVFSRGLALRQGSLRVPSAAIATDVQAEPGNVQLNGLRLAAFGGEFAGNATLQGLARYRVAGSLRHLDLSVMEQFAGRQLPYTGTISGPVEASGSLHLPDARSLAAQADLTIAPGVHGIPMRGRIEGSYAGATSDFQVANSYLVLPHTRLAVAGSTAHGLNISLVTRDLHDLLAVIPGEGPPPVTLAGGQAGFAGSVAGPLRAPRFAGHLFADRFQVEGRAFTSFAADVSASPSLATVANGSLRRGAMSAQFSGAVGMRAWNPGPQERIAADLNLQNGDLADLLAMADQPTRGFSGALTASAHITGTVGNPTGSVAVHAADGTLRGEAFDRLDAQIGLTDRMAAIQQASLVAGDARIDLSGSFQHPRDSFTEGLLQASLRTDRVDLARFRTLPGLAGQLQLDAQIAGSLGPTAGAPARTGFLLTSVQANASLRGLSYQGQAYGDLQTTVRTAGQIATADVTSDFAGSNLRLHGTAQLVAGYPIDANVQISGLAVERALAIAGHGDIPVRGKLAAEAHVRGDLSRPTGDLSLDLTNAAVYGQPLDRLQLRAGATPQTVALNSLDAVSGPSRISVTARFDHPVDRLDTGDLQFRVTNGHLDLARLKALQNARRGLAGSVEIAADGNATLAPGSPPFCLTGLNANVTAAHLAVAGKSLGGLTLAAHTAAGNRLEFNLNSDLAGAAIQASGQGQLSAGYPVDAQLSFNSLKWTRLAPLLGSPSAESPAFEITAAGKASLNGPILQTAALEGSLDVSTLQLQTLPQARGPRPIVIENQGPIQARLDRGVISLSGFHLTGPQTDIQASGDAALHQGPLNLAVNAGIDLAVLKSLNRDFTSSGRISLTGGVHGTLASPQANGSLQLQNATLFYAGIPNGLSNANGTILFQGNRASIQSLSAESGGGRVTVSGFATFGPNVRFDLHATAGNVRVLVQQGVSVVGDAELQVAGVLAHSTATGSVTLTQLNYSPQSDLGSILARAAPEVEPTPTPNPLLDQMRLDVRVRTSPAMQVRSSLAENLQTDADLRLTGSASRPSVLGRVDLDEGRLLFFGTTYNVNTGNITFANPVRIQPVLNLSLETQTKGVDVVLNVAGPIDNMKLTYTSDPPLQFQEIVALLSTGQVPTSDPTLLADQPAQPSQSFGQTSESAILGQAVANPVASRLQRVFGLSQVTIDPAFTGPSALPTAQVTLQQRISNAITFTYSQALDDPNSTLIRAEWAFNQRWSATALRDQNGIVSVNLVYKRRFR